MMIKYVSNTLYETMGPSCWNCFYMNIFALFRYKSCAVSVFDTGIQQCMSNTGKQQCFASQTL